MVWHNSFDLYYWFVNVLAGSMTMFLAIAFFVIGLFAAMFRFPTMVIGIFFALFIIMLSVYTGTLYVLVLLVIALVIGWSVARLIK